MNEQYEGQLDALIDSIVDNNNKQSYKTTFSDGSEYIVDSNGTFKRLNKKISKRKRKILKLKKEKNNA